LEGFKLRECRHIVHRVGDLGGHALPFAFTLEGRTALGWRFCRSIMTNIRLRLVVKREAERVAKGHEGAFHGVSLSLLDGALYGVSNGFRLCHPGTVPGPFANNVTNRYADLRDIRYAPLVIIRLPAVSRDRH